MVETGSTDTDCEEVLSVTSIIASESKITICGWPTDVVLIDHCNAKHADEESALRQSSAIDNRSQRRDCCKPHTLLLFVPGNPGVVHWYTDFLTQVVERLGKGYAARGVSYAGHGVGEVIVGNDDEHSKTDYSGNREDEGKNPKLRNMKIPWTMDGQIQHKIAWIDALIDGWRKQFLSNSKSNPSKETPNFIFISHSIGAHFVQCLLLRRPDILAHTAHIIHLMPFFRFDPPPLKSFMLSHAASWYEYVVPMMTTLVNAASVFPRRWIDFYLERHVGLNCPKGRKIALDIFLNPKMMRNHLVLGLQEIRELPEMPNDVALRLIGDICSTSILFCGCPDQWAPLFHMEDLKLLQRNSKVPHNINMLYIEELRHDFVVHPEMIEPVVRFCLNSIRVIGKGLNVGDTFRLQDVKSKL
mmetsp:Transcript_20439/g.41935  ORF Transcript_20439/g.41935 Transcript_20439/m.41935 type:complete len:414 (-) Transcript_20439:369-1610(-)